VELLQLRVHRGQLLENKMVQECARSPAPVASTGRNRLPSFTTGADHTTRGAARKRILAYIPTHRAAPHVSTSQRARAPPMHAKLNLKLRAPAAAAAAAPARRSATAAPVAMFTAFKLSLGGNQAAKREEAKAALLEAIKGTGRGTDADEAAAARVAAAARDLERLNPTRAVLGPALTARWELLYTTSASILGSSRPSFLRPFGPIYQSIDAEALTARNQETVPFFNAVDATLSPKNTTTVDVQFQKFYILGFIPITAPASARGTLEVTYLDDDLRISKGNKGSLFVLKRA
jgi:hypothetical protein